LESLAVPVFVQLLRPLVNMSALSPEQEAAMAGHFARLQQGVGNGVVLVAGPCEDEAFGIVLFRSEGADAARAWTEADPAAQAGVMSSELHAFRVSLLNRSWPAD
jgi:uncharacterized protein YciI